MTKSERKRLAEQILANPLFDSVLDEMDKLAVDECVGTTDDDIRERAAMEARVVRAFRRKFEVAAKAPESAKTGIA